MKRAIVVAPVAVDLAEKLAEVIAEHADSPWAEKIPDRLDIVRIPGANNGTVQAWDTLNGRLWEWLGARYDQLHVYTRRRDMPNALLARIIQVRRSDSQTAIENPRWVRFADLQSQLYDPGDGTEVRDWFRVRDPQGAVRVVVKAQMAADEFPVDWAGVHGWLGQPDAMEGES